MHEINHLLGVFALQLDENRFRTLFGRKIIEYVGDGYVGRDNRLPYSSLSITLVSGSQPAYTFSILLHWPRSYRVDLPKFVMHAICPKILGIVKQPTRLATTSFGLEPNLLTTADEILSQLHGKIKKVCGLSTSTVVRGYIEIDGKRYYSLRVLDQIYLATNNTYQLTHQWRSLRGGVTQYETIVLPKDFLCRYKSRDGTTKFLLVPGQANHELHVLQQLVMEKMRDTIECSWVDGKCLYAVLDDFEGKFSSAPDSGDLRMCVHGTHSNLLIDELESGVINAGDPVLIMPSKASAKSSTLPGEFIRVELGVENFEHITDGSIIICIQNSVPLVSEFEGKLCLLKDLTHDARCVGYEAILHIHYARVKIEIMLLLEEFDLLTRELLRTEPEYVNKKMALVKCRIKDQTPMEKFSDFPRLGRYVLLTRDDFLTPSYWDGY
ncbi:hypothetical protein OROGR_019405 [Orobanche gracilis]